MYNFIDKVVVEFRSGKGGDGNIAFIHEKNRPLGGPSGGNGGRGGSVYLRCSDKITTLVNFRHSKVFKAADGEDGKIKSMYGRKANDIYIDIPKGTVVFIEKNHQFVCDMNKVGKIFLICKGGRGGRGNLAFKNPKNKAPKIAENGLPGENKRVILELKLLADVGIIGLPSVGKSTFINCVTNSKALIGDYDFTTLVPNLGVATNKNGFSFVLADMPGLIEGAHSGKGIGLHFLRHIERCRVLIHMVDMSGRNDPFTSYRVINNELREYGMHLIDRPQIIVASKMDEENSKENLKNFIKQINKEVLPISCITDEGFDKVLYKCEELLKTAPQYPVYNDDIVYEKVYDAHEDEDIYNIDKIDDNTFVISGERVERTYDLINISTDEGMMKLITYLNKIGIDDKLREMGAKDGDFVKLKDFTFEYFD
ncbi:MAG: GTPase ObgE [Bacillales bacterium]